MHSVDDRADDGQTHALIHSLRSVSMSASEGGGRREAATECQE
jgi:hypothetical protein